ncbi:MAG TPA: flagellar hook-basal body complex protein FliE [Verrucomicrobiae bacterium]|jgi:flagellar hook-basal body complex protein FliE
MDALSAIRQFTGSELRPLPLPKAQAETQGPVPIPFKEIQELPFALNPQPFSPAIAPTESFGNVLGRLVHEVNDKQAAAGDAVRGLLGGQKVSLHQAMIAMEEASVSFQLMVEVRNKLLESYQELMRMQI